MKIVQSGTEEWRQLQAQDRKLGDARLLCSACFGPSVFVREDFDPPYLNASGISHEGWILICQPGGTLLLHVPPKAQEALDQGFDERFVLSEYIRTGHYQEAGKVTEVRSEVKKWFLNLLKGRGRKSDFKLVFRENAGLIEGAVLASAARTTAHRLLDEM